MRKQASAWNKGRLLGQKPPLKPKEIWSLRIRLQLADKARDVALFNLAIDSKLRGCDLVSLRVRDVYQGSVVSSRAIVMQRKTQRPVQFEITEATRESICSWVARRDLRAAGFLFPGRGRERHLSVRQYSRIIRSWKAPSGTSESRWTTHLRSQSRPKFRRFRPPGAASPATQRCSYIVETFCSACYSVYLH